MDDSPLLSICIPTFNREDHVVALVGSLLKSEGSFEVCVHVDGSTDNTRFRLQQILDSRLRLTCEVNRGRANAIATTISQSRGKFIMLFDDDDTLYPAGLQQVLIDCELPLPAEVCGYIYNMDGTIGHGSPGIKNGVLANFLSLRADRSLRGDKKEVVVASLVKSASADFAGVHRRVPTSLLWARVALTTDVYFRDFVVGKKHYLPAGLTDDMASLKKANAAPMVSLYVTHVRGYLLGRYKSPRFLLKALLGVVLYTLYNGLNLLTAARWKKKHV